MRATRWILIGALLLAALGFSGALLEAACMKCVTPEPDCPDVDCYACGTKCCFQDDYTFIENNSCTSGTGTCTLSDLSDCYDDGVCDKNPLFNCMNAGAKCSFHSCVRTTIKGYDDCN